MLWGARCLLRSEGVKNLRIRVAVDTRYRGVRKNLFDLRRAAAIQNLESLFVIGKLAA